MKKMITKTALVASFVLAAVSLSACGSNEDCAKAIGNDYTVTAAMLPTKGGHGGGHSSHHSNTHTGNGFRMPYWFGGGSHSECKNDTAPSSSH